MSGMNNGGDKMVYVALLRGINVGGKNKVDMKLLKKAFEEVGMRSVVTYINSGNVIFYVNDLPITRIASTLEDAIYTNFGLAIKVLVRSLDDIKKIIAILPDDWTNDQQMRSEVLFLWEEIDDETVLDKLILKPDIDRIKYVSGAILWSIDKKNITKSGMGKLIDSKIYKQMTIRNVNTTRKIYELMLKIHAF
jgi:uncharacterized protein (DUF1697 family)